MKECSMKEFVMQVILSIMKFIQRNSQNSRQFESSLKSSCVNSFPHHSSKQVKNSK
jgi:hypothetical protein